MSNENKKMSLHAASCVMGVSHTGGDILNSDWGQIAVDLEKGRTTSEKVVVLANLAFEMELISEFHYMRLIKAATDAAKINLATYMTVAQIDKYNLLRQVYKI